MQQIIQEIIQALEKYSDPERIEFNQRTCPSAMRSIGVTVPNLRTVSKALGKKVKSFAAREKIQLAIGLVNTDIHECQSLAYGLIGEDRNLICSLNEQDIDSLEKNLDNWGSVDSFGILIIGKAWRAGIINTSIIKGYLRSRDFWRRRMALVATVPLNKKSHGGTGDTKGTLEICQLAVEDPEVMVGKALSWALRELSRVDGKAVEDFIHKNKEKLQARVLREVKHKLTFGTKN